MAGSLTPACYRAATTKTGASGGSLGTCHPRFAGAAGQVKLSAGWLIEQAGLPRGTVDASGCVGLSSKHALALVNRGGASAAQVLAFARHVQAQVQAHFAVTLRAEPVLVGFAPEAVAELSSSLE